MSSSRSMSPRQTSDVRQTSDEYLTPITPSPGNEHSSCLSVMVTPERRSVFVMSSQQNSQEVDGPSPDEFPSTVLSRLVQKSMEIYEDKFQYRGRVELVEIEKNMHLLDKPVAICNRGKSVSAEVQSEAPMPEKKPVMGATRRSLNIVEAIPHKPWASTVMWSNAIRTSRYTWVSFIPKTLWYQFHYFANIYFLAAAMLQTMDAISDSGGRPLQLIPLTFVLALTAVKELVEDIKRHKSDDRENKRKVLRVKDWTNTNVSLRRHRRSSGVNESSQNSEHPVEEVEWQHLQVGDVIEVNRGEPFPADLILLTSSDPGGVVYVETKNLDGETNLKSKVALPELMDLLPEGAESCSRICAKLSYEPSSASLYSFEGEILIESSVMPLGVDQFLLRGSSLQTVQWAIGVVVYVGHHTRIFQNSISAGVSRHKMTKLMTVYNHHVIQLFAIQFLICLTAAVANVIIKSGSDYWYLSVEPAASRNFGQYIVDSLRVLGTLLLQFSYFIPISLIVTLEIVKLVEGWFISADKHMKDGERSATANSTSLVEELGSVSHVFSDKTGTLTENLMLFTCIVPLSMGTNSAIVTRAARDLKKRAEVHRPNNVARDLGLDEMEAGRVNGGSFNDSASLDCHVSDSFDLTMFMNVVKNCPMVQKVRFLDIILCLCVCHSVLVQAPRGDEVETQVEDDSGEANNSIPDEVSSDSFMQFDKESTDSENLYDASSPDELALVAGARVMGFEFIGRRNAGEVQVRLKTDFARELMMECGYWNGKDGEVDQLSGMAILTWRLLDVIEFDNDRKRMSVIVDSIHDPRGHPIMLTKGADSSMLSVACTEHTPVAHFNELSCVLDKLATGGLRTLVYGTRDLNDPDWLERWRERYSRARGMIGDDRVAAIKGCILDMEKEVSNDKAVLYYSLSRSLFSVHLPSRINCKMGFLTLSRSFIPPVLSCGSLQVRGSFCCNYVLYIIFVALGDKIETAINIGYSCNLLSSNVYNGVLDNTDAVVLNKEVERLRWALESRGSVADDLDFDENANEKFQQGVEIEDCDDEAGTTREMLTESCMGVLGSGNTKASGTGSQLNPPSELCFDKAAITVSGDTLTVILKNRNLRLKFFRLALSRCSTVIACRVSPKQKADIVRWSALFMPASTMLAIGDGANDVGMIVVSHVGVGVIGKEGAQAVRSADFAVPQFRFLQRLLFVHGRENVRKNSIFVYFTVFKNVTFSMPTFFFGFVSMFSGTVLYNAYLKQLYNVIFTLLPVIMFGIFDRDFPPQVLARCAFLYKWPNKLFGRRVLFSWFSCACWMAFWSLYIPMIATSRVAWNSEGWSNMSVEDVGMLTFSGLVTCANLMMYKWTTSMYWFTHIGYLIGIFAFFLFWWFAELVLDQPLPGSLRDVLLNPRSIASLVLFIAITWLPLHILHTHSALYNPSNPRIAKERLKMGVHDLVIGRPPQASCKADDRVMPSSYSAIPNVMARLGGHKPMAISPMRPRLSNYGVGESTSRRERRFSAYAFSESAGFDRIGRYSSIAGTPEVCVVPSSRCKRSVSCSRTSLRVTRGENLSTRMGLSQSVDWSGRTNNDVKLNAPTAVNPPFQSLLKSSFN